MIGTVASDVSVEFDVPECRMGFRSLLTLSAIMPVPEAPVDKNDRAKPRQHDVWIAGEIPSIKAKPKPLAEKSRADLSLRARVASFDCRHHSRSHFF